MAPTITPPNDKSQWSSEKFMAGHDLTCKCRVLNIHGLESPPGSEYGRGDEGADGGGQQGDVGVDVGAVPGVVRGQKGIETWPVKPQQDGA